MTTIDYDHPEKEACLIPWRSQCDRMTHLLIDYPEKEACSYPLDKLGMTAFYFKYSVKPCAARVAVEKQPWSR